MAKQRRERKMHILKKMKSIEGYSKPFIVLTGLVLVAIIGVLDYVTGVEIASSIFYLVPILLVGWFVGKKEGIFISIASSLVWLVADLTGRNSYSHPAVPYWNSAVRFGFFTIVVLMLAALKSRYLNELQLNAELQHTLKRLKQTQEELEQRAGELARSNAELEKFAYVAAHDLKGPLIGIGGYVRRLRRRLKDNLDPDAERIMEQLLEQILRMETLINSLLSYARVGINPINVKCVDFTGIVKQVIRDIRVEVEQNSALITHDHLPEITADAVQIGQLFQNLINNGIKFHREEPPSVHVSVERRGNEWVFAVKDNGSGIDSKDESRIFDMFQRADNSFQYPGNGIGLAICKKIVDNHGGRIWVESKLQEGSTFYFTIPIKDLPNSG